MGLRINGMRQKDSEIIDVYTQNAMQLIGKNGNVYLVRRILEASKIAYRRSREMQYLEIKKLLN